MTSEMVEVGWWMEAGGDAWRVGGCADVGLLACSLLYISPSDACLAAATSIMEQLEYLNQRS